MSAFIPGQRIRGRHDGCLPGLQRPAWFVCLLEPSTAIYVEVTFADGRGAFPAGTRFVSFYQAWPGDIEVVPGHEAPEVEPVEALHSELLRMKYFYVEKGGTSFAWDVLPEGWETHVAVLLPQMHAEHQRMSRFVWRLGADDASKPPELTSESY